MNYEFIINLLNGWTYIVLIINLIFMGIILAIKSIAKDETNRDLDLISQRVVEFSLFGVITILTAIYIGIMLVIMNNSSLVFITSRIILNILLMLTFAALFIELKEDKSLLLKEIENININKLEKNLIAAIIYIVPTILTFGILFSLIYLLIFPTNLLIANLILNIISINFLIIIMDIMSSIGIIILKNKKLLYKLANIFYKNHLKND